MLVRGKKHSVIQHLRVTLNSNAKGSVSTAACLFDAEQRRLSSRPLFKSQFKAFVNDVEKDSAQHEERWPEGWEVHVQQILPGNLVCPKLWISRTTAGHMARQLWQVITVQHGVWEVGKLQVEDRSSEVNSAFQHKRAYTWLHNNVKVVCYFIVLFNKCSLDCVFIA